MNENEVIKNKVKEGYGQIARQGSSCCGPARSCCGSTETAGDLSRNSRNMGYTEDDMGAVPEGSNLGLGCGNPIALASIKEGEVVLDLGSGPGFDCFLAAQKVGENGKVIGVDMTPEMIERATQNAQNGGYHNVEFRAGDIEAIPVDDNSVDIIISNCVINLAPNKGKVFAEAFRTLKPGGRLMISDIVVLKAIPDVVKNSVEAYIGCISGAILKDDYLRTIETVGFQDVRVIDEISFPLELMVDDPTARALMENMADPSGSMGNITNIALSIKVTGVKPIELS